MEVARLVVLALALAAPSGVFAQPADTTTGTMVFVCEHGAVKRVAATFFNQIAAERGLNMRAVSRGTDPNAAVPAPIREGLKADGMAVNASFSPTRMSASDFASASHVVVFDVAMPGNEKVERWDGLPAFSDGYAAASAAIRKRVEALVGGLTAKSKKE